MISELIVSGAVYLETFDGEPMANFINANRLKRLEQPLTEEMLQQLHIAKMNKEAIALLKEIAQAKALA